VKQDFLAVQGKTVRMETKANEVREAAFKFIIGLSAATRVFLSTGRAIHSSCGKNTIEVKNPFPEVLEAAYIC